MMLPMFGIGLFIIFNVYAEEDCDTFQMWNSSLCRYDRERQFNISCNMAMPEYFGPEDCILIFEKNTTSCDLEVFPFYGTKQNNLNNFRLNVYRFSDQNYILPAFNFSITGLQWNVFSIKFKPANEAAECIHFYVNKRMRMPKSWTLFYDCPLYSGIIGGQTVEMEYLAEYNEVTETRRYTFITPTAAQLDPCTKLITRRTLTYVDITFSPEVVLFIQSLPVYFQILEYQVKLCTLIEYENFSSCTSYSVIKEIPESDHISLPINLADQTGSFFFAVLATSKMFSSGSYFVSRTPVLTAPDRSLKIMLTWLIAGLLLMTSFSALSWYILRKYLMKIYASDMMNMVHPKVLLIHHPFHKSHLQVVKHFAQFLRQFCYMDVFLDIEDISKTTHKDPFMWYTEAVSSAEFIAVIPSPSYNEGSEAIYKDLFTIGLRLIHESISNKTDKTEIFNILFPYCNKVNIPPMTKHLKSLKLMEDFNTMVSYIHRHTKMHSMICRYALLKRIQSNIKYRSRLLLFSIKEAEKLFKKDNIDRDSCGKNLVETEKLLINDKINKNIFSNDNTVQDFYVLDKVTYSELEENKIIEECRSENNKNIDFEECFAFVNIQNLKNL